MGQGHSGGQDQGGVIEPASIFLLLKQEFESLRAAASVQKWELQPGRFCAGNGDERAQQFACRARLSVVTGDENHA
jgi:hypothetical protein